MTPDEIAAAYHRGTPVDEIASVAGVDPSTVWRTLRREGVELRGRADIVRARGKLTDRALRRWHKAGWTVARIAAEAGVHKTTVTERLQQLGLMGLSDRAPRPDELRRLYEDEGRTIPQVAERIGRSPRTARRYLLAAGVRLRPPGRPPS